MRVLLTGARGKVGRAASRALLAAGHEVTEVDVGRPVFERDLPGAPPYVQADLTDAGAAFAVVRGHDAVVHAAAIPDPLHNPPHVVFSNNLMSTFNVLEAAVRWQVPRFVNISSETVPGFFFPERPPFLPDYVPVDEEHPIRPQDPYALAKHFGEQLMDAAVRRSDIRCITLRPELGQQRRQLRAQPGPDGPRPLRAVGQPVVLHRRRRPGRRHRAVGGVGPAGPRGLLHRRAGQRRRPRPGGRVREAHGDTVEVRPLSRPDASGISCAKAERLLGYRPTRSWRDHLDAEGRRRT
jgi:nucleoside-diphosphate-sugar epimerase